jgi:hypothetical protein
MTVIIYLLDYEDGTDSVPKRRHIKFRRRGNNQKKTYNKTPDDGKEEGPKHVELYIKIKLRDIAFFLASYKYIMRVSILNIKLFVSKMQEIRAVKFLHNWQISSKF